MRVLRIFIKNAHNAYAEMPIPEGMSMQDIMHAFRVEGHLRHEGPPGAPWSVPWDGWAFAVILTLPDTMQPQTVGLSWPNPSGSKPN